jgi:co-chaperonin GroES (HSP10)
MARLKKENVTIKKSVGVRPLMGYVLVDPLVAESRTASGIILPESAKEKPAQGTVISTGEPIFINGKELLPPVKV